MKKSRPKSRSPNRITTEEVLVRCQQIKMSQIQSLANAALQDSNIKKPQIQQIKIYGCREIFSFITLLSVSSSVISCCHGNLSALLLVAIGGESPCAFTVAGLLGFSTGPKKTQREFFYIENFFNMVSTDLLLQNSSFFLQKMTFFQRNSSEKYMFFQRYG